jgi:hypothetical protein
MNFLARNSRTLNASYEVRLPWCRIHLSDQSSGLFLRTDSWTILHIFSPSLDPPKTPWSESASELYRPSDRRLSAKWLPTFAERGCHMVSVTDPYGRILGFLDSQPLLCYQVAPQLYSQGWVDSVPDPLLCFVVSGNRTRDPWICSQELWPLDHRGGPSWPSYAIKTLDFSIAYPP